MFEVYFQPQVVHTSFCFLHFKPSQKKKKRNHCPFCPSVSLRTGLNPCSELGWLFQHRSPSLWFWLWKNKPTLSNKKPLIPAAYRLRQCRRHSIMSVCLSDEGLCLRVHSVYAVLIIFGNLQLETWACYFEKHQTLRSVLLFLMKEKVGGKWGTKCWISLSFVNFTHHTADLFKLEQSSFKIQKHYSGFYF